MSRMDGDQGRYSAEAWERTRREALDARASEPSPRPAGSGNSPSTLVPGIVEMSLRGRTDGDVERLVAAMRAAGFVVWRVPKRVSRAGRDVGYHYFTAEVPPDDSDG